jgi:hypothetical protein
VKQNKHLRCSYKGADFILKSTNQLLFIMKMVHSQKVLYHARGDLTCYTLIEVGVDRIKYEELTTSAHKQ